MSFELNDFKTEVVEQSKITPVVLDFWAPWCGPCRTLGPIIEKLAGEAKGKWKLVKINTEQHKQLAAQFGIQSIPAVKMVYQGALVAEFTGALPEAQIKEWLKENLPDGTVDEDETDFDSVLQDAYAEGNRTEVHRILELMLSKDPQNLELKASLAMSWLPDDATKSRNLLEGQEANGKWELHFQTISTIEHLKQVSEKDSTGTESLQQYSSAAKALFLHDYNAAVSGFLEVLAKDRELFEDGARKACIAIFMLLGDQHPVSKTYRRRFSMLLY